VHLGRNGLVHFRVFFFAFGTASCLILFFLMRKQQENRMILPLSTSSMHASAFLMPERPIAEFWPFCLNGIELRSSVIDRLKKGDPTPTCIPARH
jgi:hypothetical protein